MTRLRFLAAALLALMFAGNPTQTGTSAGQSEGTTSNASPSGTKTSAAADGSCTIYALSDMGYDSDLGAWIAETIPQMIEWSSWQGQGGMGVLRYYAPKNILIINNSAAIHAKVDGFLKELKSSLPKGSASSFAASKKSRRASVVPAEYRAPAPLRTSSPAPEPSSYPIPAPVKPPKHLFHFLIRYEGEGIIDDNVVKYMKATNAGGSSSSGIALPAPLKQVIETNDAKGKENKKDDEKEKPATSR